MARVLVYTDAAPSVSETFIMDHFDGISHEKMLVCRVPSDKAINFSERLARLGAQYRLLYDQRPGALENLRFAFGTHRKLKAILQEFRPDVVHVHYLTNTAFLLPYLHDRAISVVVTAHGYDATVTPSQLVKRPAGMLFLARLPLIRKRIDRVLAVSEFIRGKVIGRGFAAEQVKVHTLGVDTNRFRPVSPERVRSKIVFCGRLVEKKGAIWLLRAAKEMKLAGGAPSVRLIGDGPERGELEQFAQANNLDVEFVGAVAQSGLDAYFSDAALLCFPSTAAASGDNEGLPLVPLEAQCRGLPVVAFDQGPIPEAVTHGVTGLLAKDRDEKDLARALSTLLDDRELADRLGANGAARVKAEFSLAQQSARLDTLYSELATRQEGG